MRVGHEGTCAILGFSHNLLQLSSYDGESLHVLQGHPFGKEPELLLAQAQLNGSSTSSGFGLQFLRPDDAFVRFYKRGFMSYKWPAQTFFYDSDQYRFPKVEHALTYVQDKSLLQVVGVASLARAFGVPIKWSLGGNILLNKQKTRYDVSENGQVLTISYDIADAGTFHGVDIELFINGEPHKFELSSPQSGDYVDITQSGVLTNAAAVLVARFTPHHDATKFREALPPPDWMDIKKHFNFYPREKHPLAMKLKENLAIKNGHRLRRLIIYSVERLLHVAFLPNGQPPAAERSGPISPRQEDAPNQQDASSPEDVASKQAAPVQQDAPSLEDGNQHRYILLDNLVQQGGGKPKLDYEASL